MAGFGNSALGTSPFGVGTPVTGDPLPEGPIGVRFLNPKTGDYEQDPGSLQLRQMPATRQRVMLAMLTAFGSNSAIPDMGLKRPGVMDEAFERVMENNVRIALRRELTDKLIRIDAILIERQPHGRALIDVSYTDLTTGESDAATALI